MNEMKIVGTAEILSAVLGSAVKFPQEFKADPKAYIFGRFNFQVDDDVSIAVVENDGDTIHLALPYYAGAENINIASLLDTDMEHAAGGFELGAILPIIIASILGVSVVGGGLAALGNK